MKKIKTKFEVGDKVMLDLTDGCPYDEQIPEEMVVFIKVCQKTDVITKVKVWEDGNVQCTTKLFGELNEGWLRKVK